MASEPLMKMQCMTAAFGPVNYAFKSDNFQGAAFIRNTVAGGVDGAVFQACDRMFNNFF